jgi:hypothetical protein
MHEHIARDAATTPLNCTGPGQQLRELQLVLPCSLDEFLGPATSVDKAIHMLATALASNGFTLQRERELGLNAARLGYSQLFEVTGPKGEELVVKVVGGNARDLYPLGVTMYDSIEKDLNTLRVAAHEPCLPDLVASIVDQSGATLGVLVSKIDCSVRLDQYLSSCAAEEKSQVLEKVISLLQNMTQKYGLELWDHQLMDIVLINGEPLFVDAGSFDVSSNLNRLNSAGFITYLRSLD